jgi:hypothetical protein
MEEGEAAAMEEEGAAVEARGEEEGEEVVEVELEEGDEAEASLRLTPKANNNRARSRSRLRLPLPRQSGALNVSGRALYARPRRRPTAAHAAARVTAVPSASANTARARPVRRWLRRTRARRR